MTNRKHLVLLAAVILCPAFIATAGADETDPAAFDRLMAIMDTSGLRDVNDTGDLFNELQYNALFALAPESLGPQWTNESFTRISEGSGQIVAESPNFIYEWRPATASFLIQKKPDSDWSNPVAGGLGGLNPDTKARIAQAGIPTNSLSSLAGFKLKAGRKVGASGAVSTRVKGIKRLAERELNGVNVLGSRIVVSYDKDRSFRRALGHWPALAPEGHVLTTPLTTQEVVESAARYLIETDDSDVDGAIRLRYVYVPDRYDDSRVRLRLMLELTLLKTSQLGDSNDDSVGVGEKIRIRYMEVTGEHSADQDE